MSRLPSARRTSSTSVAPSRAPNPGGRSSWRATTSRGRRARTPATRSSRHGRGLPRGARRRPTTAARFSTGSPRRWRRGWRARVGLQRSARGRRAVDRVVWYAGWADKLAQVLGSSNPVAGPYFNFTLPEPTGVVAVIAPDEPALDGLVGRVVPALVGGNAVVVVALGGASARRDRARRGGRDLGRAAGGREHPHRSARRARAGARGAHGRQRDRRHRRGRRSRCARGARRGERQDGSCGRARSAAPGRSARSWS